MAHGQDETDQIAPQEWIDALDRSDADIAAGRVVSGDGLMQRLRESIAEMKAERALGKVRRTSTENLAAALAEAETRIERNPDAGLRAPRPYPKLVRPGCAWLKAGRYWVAYTLTEPPLIVGVFFETADIPRRFAAY
jgi:hypothetical protein